MQPFRRTLQQLLAYKSIVFSMMTDPKPQEICLIFDGQRAEVQSHPNRPKSTDLFHVERRVTAVLL
jgi:hypothetical protein